MPRTVHKIVICSLLALSGCGFTGGISTLGSQAGGISGTAASLFGIPSATISEQMQKEIIDISGVAMGLAMLRAQLNGQVPTLPQGTAPTPVTVTNSAANPVPAKTVP